MPIKEETKQKLIKEVVEMIENKAVEVENYLISQGTGSEDVDDVMIEAKKEIVEQYRKEVAKPKVNPNKPITSVPEHYHKEINSLLLKGKSSDMIVKELKDNKVKEEHLLEFIKIEKESIIKKSSNQLKTLISNNIPVEQALKSTINIIFTTEIAEQQLAEIQNEPTFVAPKPSNPTTDSLVLGLLMIFVGVLLSIASYSMPKAGGTYLVFVGLTISGLVKTIVALIKISTSK